ncbi:universal stress protein [Nocardia sp. CS682]|uniref:universal stress protein n=1 Tax=Nocardia sp. CS682 TaxID=1047172 RepID=UPI0010754DC8|nr:universal stress protein [Nocardia sp. CS682]QBS45336.1 universal stress protein [Nocardia sp. CS682]
MSANTINLPVLVGTDGSACGTDAVRWAAVDAARHGAPLHIVYAIGAPVDFGPGLAFNQFDYDGYRKAGAAAVAAAKDIATAAAEPIHPIDITTFVVEAPPIPVLRDRSKDARLLVVGSRGLGAFRRGLLGSVSTSLARHAHCPVAVIPESEDTAPDRAQGAVVVGVDGSPAGARAVEIAFDEASRRGATVLAVLTWSEFNRYIPRSDMQKEAEELLAESLAGYAEKYPEVRVSRLVVEERPAKCLLGAAKLAQLIVVGSHGSGGFAGMTLGSVSQAVLHGADCPVIIARSAS